MGVAGAAPAGRAVATTVKRLANIDIATTSPNMARGVDDARTPSDRRTARLPGHDAVLPSWCGVAEGSIGVRRLVPRLSYKATRAGDREKGLGHPRVHPFESEQHSISD